MKRFLFALVATVAITAPALADEGLAKEKHCTTCHSAEKTKVGPSYKNIAKKYADQKDAEAKLVTVIMKGGTGSFGTTAMPPQPSVNDAEAKQLATWILGMK